MHRVMMAALVTTAMAGCGGVSYDSTGYAATGCVGTLAGGGTRAESSRVLCPNCGGVKDSENSIDGQRHTFAEMAFGVVNGTLTLRATAQEGVVFPAGHQAGAIMHFPDTQISTTLTIRTFLDGRPQESASPSSGLISVVPYRDQDYEYTFTTQAPFDTVQLEVTRGVSNVAYQVRVYEFCSRG